MKKILFLAVTVILSAIGKAQSLKIIDHDYTAAITLAEKENKLLFIDFYTNWCVPCKKINKLIFENDSVTKDLANDFILLRYNAEVDSLFNLSKKHHINSYPTALILTPAGYVINRKYGFVGDDVKELSASIFDFTKKSIELHDNNKILKGYSNKIDISKYPKFYIDYVNRINTKVKNTAGFKNFWHTQKDILAEEYFSTLVYFAGDVPLTIASRFLKNKEKYIELYGETDVNTALLFFTYGRFDSAIKSKKQADFSNAIKFSKQALGEEATNQILPRFQKKFSESVNK